MSAWNEIFLITGMMAVTFGVRYPLLALAGAIDFPPTLIRALKYVPVAVLTAIAIPMMLKPEGALSISFTNHHLLAGIASIAVASTSRHLLLTILVGMLIFITLRIW